MRRLRTLTTRRLYGIVAAVAALAITGGIAQAALSGSATAPPPKPLDLAVLDALRAPDIAGVSARVTFTNGLLPGGSMPNGGVSPLAAGAEGRLWVAGDGRFRLELQSDTGDAQIADDGERLTVYDPASKTAYTAPSRAGGERAHRRAADARRCPPRARPARGRLAAVGRPARHDRQPAELHGADRAEGRRRPARRRGARVGRGQGRAAARRGLRAGRRRAGARARGHRREVRLDPGLHVLRPAAAGRRRRRDRPDGCRRVRTADDRARRRRRAAEARVRARGAEEARRAAAHERAAGPHGRAAPARSARTARASARSSCSSTKRRPRTATAAAIGLRLPEINIDGATGTELATPLGTVVTFTRGGVSYIVAGSVPPVAAESAARELR